MELKDREIRSLKSKIEDLKEEIRQRDREFGPAGTFPVRLRLEHAEDVALSALRSAHPAPCGHDALILRIWGAEAEVGPEHLQSLITRLRRKVEPHGIRLQTRFGAGYGIDPETLEAVDALRKFGTLDRKPGRASREAFTDAEDAKLRELWEKRTGAPTIVETLAALGYPLRTVARIRGRAAALGLEDHGKRKWSKREDEIVATFFRLRQSAARVRKALRSEGFERSIKAIWKRREDIGLNPTLNRRFTDQEKAIIERCIREHGNDETIRVALARAGFVRPVTSIAGARRRIVGPQRLRWTPPRIEKLKALIEEGKSWPEIAAALETGEFGVRKVAGSLGLFKTTSAWTPAQIKRLRDGAENGERLLDVAIELSVNYQRASSMSRRLGLSYKAGQGNSKLPPQTERLEAAE